MLFLTSPRVLEPNLSDSFAQSRRQSYPFQILPVRVAVDLEVGLQDLDLLLGERSPYPLGFVLAIALGITAILAGSRPIINQLHVVSLAQHPVVNDGKLFSRGELSSTGVARKARQVEHEISRPSHPIR